MEKDGSADSRSKGRVERRPPPSDETPYPSAGEPSRVAPASEVKPRRPAFCKSAEADGSKSRAVGIGLKEG